MTTGVWLAVRKVERSRLQSLKQSQASALAHLVEGRMVDLEQALRGASGYLGRGPLPTRSEWRAYVERLDLPMAYPGVQGFSFVEWIPRPDLPDHLRRVRREGFPDYAVVPGGSAGPLAEGASTILYLEPMNAENQHAFGKDMLEDATRRQAMLQARDTGLVVTSGPLVLYQDARGKAQPGVVLYGPVFREGQPVTTVAERRAALRGWATIPLRMDDFIRSILTQSQPQAELKLFDSGEGAGNQLYGSDPSHPDAGMATRWTLNVPGRTWVARIEPSPDFHRHVGHPRHWQFLLAGLIISLLVFTLLIFQTGAEARAKLLARLRSEELLASEAQFRALFERAPFGMAIVDSATGRFLSVNGQLGHILGYPPEEILARDFQSFTHPDHLASDLASVRDLASGAVPVIHKEKRYLHRDGHDVWARLSMVKLPVLPGEPARHLSIAEDINDLRQSTRALQDSEQKFRTLFDLSPDPITLSRLSDGEVLLVNQAWCDLTGFRPEEVMGRRANDLGAWSRHEARSALMEELREGSQVAPREGVFQCRDGSLCQLLVTARVVHLEGEAYALIVAKDVTSRAKALQDLKDSEARWQFALEGAGDGVWDWTEGAESLFVSARYKEMLGYGAAENPSFTFTSWVEMIHPEDRDRVMGHVEDYLQGRSGLYQAEYRVRCKNGDFIWVLARGMASARNADGRPTRMIGTHSDITQRKLTEEALRAREADLALAQELGDFGSWRVVFDGEGEAWSVSDGLRRLYGYGPGHPITMQTGFEVMHPEDRAFVQAAWEAAMAGTGPCHWEHRTVIGDDIRWLSVRVLFRFNEEGRLKEATGIVQDITRKRVAEEALRLSEARLRILGDQLPDSFLYQFSSRPGEAPRFIYLSAGVEPLCGLKAEEVVRDPALLFSQVDPAMLPTYLEAEAISGRDLTPFAMDLRLRHMDGRWRWFRVRSKPRPQPDGSMLWEGISTDITETHEARLLLEESEARFRTVSEESPVALFLHRGGRFLYLNQAALKLLKAGSESDLIGQPVLERVHPEDREQVLDRIRMAYEKNGEAPLLEERLVALDGSIVNVEVQGRVVTYDGGAALLVFAQDVTARKQAEVAELRAQKAESLVLMAGSIAHDFNNIFQGVLGFIEVAKMRAAQNPEIRQMLGKAEGSLRKAIGLSWKMLDFSGRALVKPERLDLEAWLPAFAATLQLDLPGTLALDVACEPTPFILGDRARLEEVLQALVANAQEAAEPLAGRVHLRLCTDFGADQSDPASPGIWPLARPAVPATVCLEVADEGPGVPAMNLERICDPFFTTRELGRGLGLASVMGILQAHHAGLHILNGAQGGLVVRMHFPPGGA
ncbi:MAG: PAS domain S-box protein [Holophagaceae bacterium]|nr:PAS domain S-box protein [Holophagaceae bacterium]